MIILQQGGSKSLIRPAAPTTISHEALRDGGDSRRTGTAKVNLPVCTRLWGILTAVYLLTRI